MLVTYNAEDAPTYAGQAADDTLNFEVLQCALEGTGVVSGCEVTWVSGFTLNVASGVVKFSGVPYPWAGGNITLSSADANDRRDLICLNLSGVTVTAAATKGADCSVPGWTGATGQGNPPVAPHVPSSFVNNAPCNSWYVPGGAGSLSAGGSRDLTTAPIGVPTGITVTVQTAGYTFALTDANTEVDLNSATAAAFTIPANSSVAFPNGNDATVLVGRQVGVGVLTFTGASGVFVNGVSGGSISASAQYGTLIAVEASANHWYVIASGAPAPGLASLMPGLMPATAIAENFPRMFSGGSDAGTPAAGVPLIFPGPYIPAGKTVSTVNLFQSGTAPTSQSHAWVALLDITGKILAISADAGSTVWNAGTFVDLAISLAASYTSPGIQTLISVLYAGSGSWPTLRGMSTNGGVIDAWSPCIQGGSSTTGQTTPPAVGTSLGLPTSGSETSNTPYAFVS